MVFFQLCYFSYSYGKNSFVLYFISSYGKMDVDILSCHYKCVKLTIKPFSGILIVAKSTYTYKWLLCTYARQTLANISMRWWRRRRKQQPLRSFGIEFGIFNLALPIIHLLRHCLFVCLFIWMCGWLVGCLLAIFHLDQFSVGYFFLLTVWKREKVF